MLVISIVDSSFERTLEIAKQYKFVELRLDEIDFSVNQIEQIVEVSEKTIITGLLDCYNPFLVNIINDEKVIIDIPFDSLQEQKNILDTFSVVEILVSYHRENNSTELFNLNKIDSIIKKMIAINDEIKRINYFKIAVTINTEAEEKKYFSLFDKYPEIKGKLILIPFGKKFQYSRIKSLKLGSPLMYCYIDKPATECQLHYDEYEK